MSNQPNAPRRVGRIRNAVIGGATASALGLAVVLGAGAQDTVAGTATSAATTSTSSSASNTGSALVSGGNNSTSQANTGGS